jgi:hypothetical protein
MADFKTIKDLINEEIVTNGQGLIDAVLLRGILIGILDAVGVNLDNKVDTETGKGLSANDFTNALKSKLNNMPYITAYDYANHLVTLSDGDGHSQVYQLTPYVQIPDYYVGWTSGNAASFQAKTAEELVNGAGNNHFMVTDNPTYQHACINKIFYLLFKTDKAPTVGSLVSGGLESQISTSDFLSGGIIHHDPITYNGTTYKVYTYADDDLISDSNIITVNFQ